MDKKEFVAELSKLRPASTFLTVKGYRNEYSEVADYSIVFHMNYKTALERSIETLNKLAVADDLEKQARQELVSSFQHSLFKLKETPVEELEDHYQHFTDENGKYIKGVKLHLKTDTLHLYGLVVHKRVLMPGYYPARNRKPFTVVKDKMRALTSVGKFRQFKMQLSQVDEIVVDNLSLLPPY